MSTTIDIIGAVAAAAWAQADRDDHGPTIG
jgi:hypothetical protein